MKFYSLKLVIVATISLFIAFLPLSCGDEDPFADESDCNDCISPKPEYASLAIDLTRNKINSGVVIRIFKGKYTPKMMTNDDQLVFLDTARSMPYSVDVSVDTYYSVVAEYTIDDKKYYVVDGDKIKAYSLSKTCNSDCWRVKGGNVDCQLKF